MLMSKAIEGFFLTRALDLSPNTVNIYQLALSRMVDYLNDPGVKEITSELFHVRPCGTYFYLFYMEVKGFYSYSHRGIKSLYRT